jgi:hypothetical protein
MHDLEQSYMFYGSGMDDFVMAWLLLQPGLSERNPGVSRSYISLPNAFYW